MITYHGFRNVNGDAIVFVMHDGVRKELPLRLDLSNHSPTGFEWGYGGSGPAQLALALLAHANGNDGLAIRNHQDFKWDVIGKLGRAPGDTWELTQDQICDWCQGKKGTDDEDMFDLPA